MSYKIGGFYKKFTVTNVETGEEVTEPTFTLIPDRDTHARVALAAYAESVREENIHLSNELYALLGSD